ncbi:hypothetical protein K8Q98_02905 [Candidatus Nomurabacteria bacterium]|nr:hypothetical protein [Candidatus Nomurabacteria bacterium]
MGILDTFRKSKEVERPNAAPVKKGFTLAEILQDKEKSHLFGKLLERYGREDLSLRLTKGELEENDIANLEQDRLHFVEIMDKAEKVKGLLTTENVVEFAHNHPEFEQIVNLVGPEKAKKVIQGQLVELAFADEYRFDIIADRVETYESYKNGEYKKLNEKVEKMLEDGNFTEQEYIDALNIQDPKAKKKALQELASKSQGKFKKVVNFLSRGKFTRGKLEELENNGISMEKALEELNSHQSEIGSVLFGTMTADKGMREALHAEITGVKKEGEKKTSFGDARREKAAVFNQASFDAAWEEFKKREAYGAAHHYEKDGLKDMFIEEQKQAYREKSGEAKGFWESIFSSFFEEEINSKKNTLE